MNTTYTVSTATSTIGTRSSKQAAIKLAEANKGTDAVEVHTNKGTLVHTVPAVGTRAKPFTRTEVPSFDAPAREGFEVAYSRKRVAAVIYRATQPAEDEDRYLVVQLTTGAEWAVANTTEARKVTNALADIRRKAQAEAAAQA